MSGPVFRLADYLEQHGRTTRRRLCPPASFWHAAHTHLTDPDDLRNLATAAARRQRLQWAHYLWRKVADTGHADALSILARMREQAGDREDAETLYRQGADTGGPYALATLAQMRKQNGDREGAETLYWQAADTGHADALTYLARMREEAGDREGAETLYRHVRRGSQREQLIARIGEWEAELARLQAVDGRIADATRPSTQPTGEASAAP
ncbi:hypothetical protein [Streptomyces sp. NPDC000994]